MKTLREVLGSDKVFDILSYDNHRAAKMFDVNVVGIWDSTDSDEPNPWTDGFKVYPGTHRNVFTWYELENGYGVGFNENPSRGWSFPVVKL